MRSLILGAFTAVAVLLGYGMMTIVSRLWRAHRGLPPAPRHLGLVTLSAFAISTALHLAIPFRWHPAAEAIELAMLLLAAAMLPIAAALALMLRLGIVPSTRRLATGGLAVVALAAMATALWSYAQVRSQRALDLELQRAAARRAEHADVLQRHAELQARLARVQALIEEVIALREGRPPAAAPPSAPRRDAELPVRVTWNPLLQRQAIEERTRRLDELSWDVARAERLERRRDEIERQRAALAEQEEELEPLARELRAQRAASPFPGTGPAR